MRGMSSRPGRLIIDAGKPWVQNHRQFGRKPNSKPANPVLLVEATAKLNTTERFGGGPSAKSIIDNASISLKLLNLKIQ